MYNKVELCGVNTAELPILSEQEKRDLLTRARAGDKEARQSMIEGNLRLVLSVVQRFSQRGENMDESMVSKAAWTRTCVTRIS